MEFFDGRQENLFRSGRGWLRREELKEILKPGQTRLTMALSHVWLTLLILLALLIPWIFFSVVFGFLEGTRSGMNCFLALFFLIIIIIGVPSVLIVFITMLITSSKRLKRNKVHLSDEFMEVLYWKGEKDMPLQVTRIPYRYINEVRPVSNEEWRKDMKMGNPFRMIALWPYLGPTSRFQPGTQRKHVYTIEFDRKMQFHGYSDTQGTVATILGLTISWLFLLLGGEVEEELYVDDRMYISMSGKDHKKMMAFIGKRTITGEDASHDRSGTGPGDPVIAPEEIDDSSYMNLSEFETPGTGHDDKGVEVS
ncbi:MAG: hypothetical protein ACMUHY_05710 [Thermoplasmatota archaeon]